MFSKYIYIIFILLLSSCNIKSSSPLELDNKNQPQEPEKKSSENEIPDVQIDQLSYKFINEQILLKNCTECHNPHQPWEMKK